MQLLTEALQYSVFNFTANVGVEKMPLYRMQGMGKVTGVFRQLITSYNYNHVKMIQVKLAQGLANRIMSTKSLIQVWQLFYPSLC